MKKPLISVVIPAYNEEKYLPACLKSLQKQTFKDFEIIVVDNNSSDSTAVVARRFGARVVKELKQGLIYAREKGFKVARAEIIARTDADATVNRHWVETIYNAFYQYPNVVALTGTLLSPTKKISNKPFRALAYLCSVILGKSLSGHYHLIGGNMAIRKKAWEKIKVHFDDKLVHEDICLSCHLAEIGEIKFLPEMKATLSLRRVQRDPIKGLGDYLIEYPWRYVQTLRIHPRK